MSDWKKSCQIQKVRQRDTYGCGVACTAMVIDWEYGRVRSLFEEAGIGKRKHKPLSTNFSELMDALRAVEVESSIRRWQGWDSFEGLGILAVSNSGGPTSQNWHWVVAERHPAFGVVIHDPDTALPCFQHPPTAGHSYIPLEEYEPRKSWIQIKRPAANQ